MTLAQMLRILARYTDLITLFDLEDKNIRAHIKIRGRNEPPTAIEGDIEDVIKRALCIVGAGLPPDFRTQFDQEMALFTFPPFEEYLRMFDDDLLETLSAIVWFERYESSKAAFLEYVINIPEGARVMPYNPKRYGNFKGYTAHVTTGDDPAFAAKNDAVHLRPLSSEPHVGWYLPRKEWWRFFQILPNKPRIFDPEARYLF